MKRKKHTSFFKTLRNIISGPIDLLDDIWPAFKAFLPSKVINGVGPYISGGGGFIIHLGEGFDSIKATIKAYKNKAIGQRKTKIFTRLGSHILAAFGFISSIALLAHVGVGVYVPGEFLLPAFITGLSASICSLTAYRKAYTFYVLKNEEKTAEEAYQSLKRNASVNNENDANLVLKAFHDYIEKREKRLAAERKLAYASLESFSSGLVLVGTVLATAILMGVNLAVNPFSFLLTGALSGIAIKLFESQIDARFDYAPSHAIRHWFVKTWDKLVSHQREAAYCEVVQRDERLSQPTFSTTMRLMPVFANNAAKRLPDQTNVVQRTRSAHISIPPTPNPFLLLEEGEQKEVFFSPSSSRRKGLGVGGMDMFTSLASTPNNITANNSRRLCVR